MLAKNLALARASRPAARGGAGPPANSKAAWARACCPIPSTWWTIPTQKEWRGKALFGSYDVDREGVMAKPLHLVEKGVLEGFPADAPAGARVRRLERPGAAAGPQANDADISNLFVTSSETMPAADMKKKLIELIQSRNKPYGIIVRKMDFPSTAATGRSARADAGCAGQPHPVSMPLLVYKVFPDGREELVRGMRFRGFNARSLRDILAAGDDATAFDFMDSTAPFALVDGARYTTEACVIAPSILIDDLELHPVDEELPKLPLVTGAGDGEVRTGRAPSRPLRFPRDPDEFAARHGARHVHHLPAKGRYAVQSAGGQQPASRHHR